MQESPVQRGFNVETHSRNKPYENLCRKFKIQFPGVSVPSKLNVS
jgi:hypothetical protein